jgi:hypothetical protein
MIGLPELPGPKKAVPSCRNSRLPVLAKLNSCARSAMLAPKTRTCWRRMCTLDGKRQEKNIISMTLWKQ